MISRPDGSESIVREAFIREVPEIASGVVEIQAIARMPGVRTKVAVTSNDVDVDAVGACVGPNALRIQRIVSALGGERIDITPWSDVLDRYIKLALAPLKVVTMELNHEEHHARLLVKRASGFDNTPVEVTRELASRLTGWSIDFLAGSDT
jgi:N utilization substance protein A